MNINSQQKENAPAIQTGAFTGVKHTISTQIIADDNIFSNPFDNIPKELKARPQWVVHRNKQPFNPATSYGAKAGDSTTWTTFQAAVDAYTTGAGNYDGIGFEFDNNGLVGIDLDTVRDPATGEIAQEAAEIITALSSYTEISPSGYGFHIICNADIPLKWNKARLPDNNIKRPDIDFKTGLQRYNKQGSPLFKTPEIEMYTEKRYFTITGNVWGSTCTIETRTQEVRKLQNQFSPTRNRSTVPVERCSTDQDAGGKNYLVIGLRKDTSFQQLWEGKRPNGNESADDLALMNKLAYWCNCDVDQMVAAFENSPHCQQKDPQHAKKAERNDYLQRTAARAAADCTTTAQERDSQFKATKEKSFAKKTAIEDSKKIMDAFRSDQIVPDLLQTEYHLNDLGNAQRFLYFYETTVRYSKEANAWYIWNGKRWEQDFTGKIFRLAIKVAKTYKITIDTHLQQLESDVAEFKANPDYLTEHPNSWITNTTDPQRILKAMQVKAKHATSTGMASRLTAMIEEAGHVAFISQQELDQHRHLITCENGTIDLITGELHPHNPEHFITKMANAEYHPNASAPTFMAFLSRIFQNNQELMRYIQKAMGYCITGETREQCFFIGYGTGANGKSTLIEAIRNIMEEYTQTIPTGVLMDKDKESNATPELARAKGARFVIASESKDIAYLNEAQTKQLTGEDKISARPLYSQGFEFKPTFKIWLSTNHKPNIKGTDNGIWRRVHLIPFDITIPEEEQDTQLPQKLQKEQSGIFAWLVEGARLYYAEGLERPAAVKAATEDYRTEMDVLGGFILDCIERTKGAFTRSNELYNAYLGWCVSNGVDAMKQNAFSRKLTDRGMTAKRTAIARGYLDIKLTEMGLRFAQPEDFRPITDVDAPPEWRQAHAQITMG